MGTLTFTQLQNEVRFGLGGRTDCDTRLPYIINLAQQRLARIHDFDEMELTTTGSIGNTGSPNDRFIVLPLKREIYSITLLYNAQSRKLVGRTPQYWDRQLPMPEYWARNIPSDYTVWNNTAEVFPLPDITYTTRIRWTQWPADLVNPTDVSTFLHKDEILVELALVYILKSLGKEDDASKHANMAAQLIAEAIMNDDTKPDISILPAPSDSQTISGQLGNYWLNPFIKG